MTTNTNAALVDAQQPAPPAQAADSVLEDAARYRWLRGNAADFWSCVMDATGLYVADGREADAAIDAARSQAKEGA